MRSEMENKAIREAVAVFDKPEDLEETISELQSSGVDRADLSILAPPASAEPLSGSDVQAGPNPSPSLAAVVSDTDLRQGRVLATGLAATIAGFAAAGVTAATGGIAAATIAAATAAGGVGVASTLLGRRLDDEHTAFLNAQLARGGILLWVHMRDPGIEKTVLEVLRRRSTNVVVHDLPAESATAQSPPIVDQPARQQ
jgi:hypothetical protein